MLHVRKLAYIEPNVIFRLLENDEGTIFLDSNFSHSHYGRYSYIALNPLYKFVDGSEQSLDMVLEIWQQLFAINRQSVIDLPPFIGGLLGYLSYDLFTQIEHGAFPSTSANLAQTHSAVPEVPAFCLGLYNQVFAFDHHEHCCYILVSEIIAPTLPLADVNYAQQFAQLLAVYNRGRASTAHTTHAAVPLTTLDSQAVSTTTNSKLHMQSNYSAAEYQALVARAIEYIRAGDIFEVNLAQCFSAELPIGYSAPELYQKLRIVNKAPFAAYLNFAALKILSASPERFLAIRGRKLEARPIKGTITRARSSRDDAGLAKQLLTSAKDRAENVMIVDLMRNDLSRICKADSVVVSKLCGVESFTNVHHLVSVIEGELLPDVSPFAIIKACFPGGSITGAPKIRAMQIINELENVKRGVYCGSIGYFSFSGDVDLSITIRTIIINGRRLSYHVGGAVTLHSDPVSEYQETILKGQKLAEVL